MFLHMSVLQAILQCVFSGCVMWAVGAILDISSESWLLKGVLLACVFAMINLTCRYTQKDKIDTRIHFRDTLVCIAFYPLVKCSTFY